MKIVRQLLELRLVRRPGTSANWHYIPIMAGMFMMGLMIGRMAQAQRWTDFWLITAAALALSVGTLPLRLRAQSLPPRTAEESRDD